METSVCRVLHINHLVPRWPYSICRGCMVTVDFCKSVRLEIQSVSFKRGLVLLSRAQIQSRWSHTGVEPYRSQASTSRAFLNAYQAGVFSPHGVMGEKGIKLATVRSAHEDDQAPLACVNVAFPTQSCVGAVPNSWREYRLLKLPVSSQILHVEGIFS